jgi:hypothetical protein
MGRLRPKPRLCGEIIEMFSTLNMLPSRDLMSLASLVLVDSESGHVLERWHVLPSRMPRYLQAFLS